MRTRIISGFIMLPLLMFFYLGGIFVNIFSGIVCVLASYELITALNKNKIYLPKKRIYFMSSMLYLSSLIIDANYYELIFLWTIVSFFLSISYLFEDITKNITATLITFFMFIYIGIMPFHIVMISNMDKIYLNGESNISIWIWLVIITALGSDTCAYFTGVLFGKNKLCENISPKKTIEGAIGGVVGSALLSGLFMFFIDSSLSLYSVILGMIAAVAGQFGDLTASIFKRNMGIKDYGHLIPGHGGVLDRVDSILFTAPIVYWYLVILIKLQLI